MTKHSFFSMHQLKFHNKLLELLSLGVIMEYYLVLQALQYFYSSLYILFHPFCLGQGGCGVPILRTIQKASGLSSDPAWARGCARWSQGAPSNLIHSKTDTLHDIIKNISHFNSKMSHCISSYNWNTFHHDIIQKNWAILGRVNFLLSIPSCKLKQPRKISIGVLGKKAIWSTCIGNENFSL